MARFDYTTFLELTGGGQGPVQALGTVFGMPSCLVNLGAEVLGLLPSPILNSIRGSTANGANRADDVIKAAFSKLRFLNGIIEYDTEDGTFRFVSDSSKNGLDKNEGSLLNNLGGFLGALGQAAGFAGRLYNNYQTTQAQIDSIKDCLQSYDDYQNYTGANSAERRMELASRSPAQYQEMLDQQFGIEKQDLQEALKFKLDCLTLIRNIDRLISARLKAPETEPQFLPEYIDVISGTEFNVESPEVVQKVEEVFRLTFGPPKSKQGKFILSVDGLYFDSQTSGIVPALIEIERRKDLYESKYAWKLESDPNIGGRGKQISLSDLKSYVKTILDPNIVDDSVFLKEYYTQDNFLQDLIGQKNRRIFDVSAQIASFQASGLSQALISNLRQVMLSETSHHMEKINRRKKQIELAVKMPAIYGKGFSYEYGKIPVNDFSYLEGINFEVDLEAQKHLIFDQSEVSGVVLPLQVKYTEQIQNSNSVVMDHLLVSNLGLGSIISDVSGNEAPNLTINHSITTDGLISLFTYLTVDIESTSSTDYNLHNSSKKGNRLNGQLVGTNPSDLFNLGLGIVHLDGITKNRSDSIETPSALGSYIRLPDAPELQDLLYTNTGATIETWVCVPGINASGYVFDTVTDIGKFYRLILANENTGCDINHRTRSSVLQIPLSNGSDVVKGLIFGFTVDRRITQNENPSDSILYNTTQDACLFLAPTQSYGSGVVGFISKSLVDSNNCHTSNGWYNMKVPIFSSTNGFSLSSAINGFVHLAVTFDPPKNRIKIYGDGNLLATSSYTGVFGISNPLAESVNIPSFKKNNSFEYNEDTMDVAELQGGPKLDTYFTPWILGGGYTDGMLENGNFMGGDNGGIKSGLNGYLGSTKFYNKPLSQEEVVNNYRVNEQFFKNIDAPQEDQGLLNIEVYTPGVETLRSSKYTVEVFDGSSYNDAYVFSATRTAIAANGGPGASANLLWVSGSSPVMHHLTFGIPSKTLARITKVGSNITSLDIRPRSKNIPYILADGKAIIEVNKLNKLWLTINNDVSSPLFVFSDPLKPPIPSENCLYYSPGIHTIGSGVSSVSDGTTVYLDGGAYVKGTFILNNKNNVKFIGPGILAAPSGLTRENFVIAHPNATSSISAFLSAMNSGYNMIKGNYFYDEIYGGGTWSGTPSGLIVSGLTIVNCPHFSIVGMNIVDNFKLISPWVWSTDGPYMIPDRSTRKSYFTNSFVFNADDCLVGQSQNKYNGGDSYASSLSLYTVANGPIALTYNSSYYGNEHSFRVSALDIDAGNYQYANAHSISSNSFIKALTDGTSSVSAYPFSYGIFDVLLSGIRVEDTINMPIFRLGNIHDPFAGVVSGDEYGNLSGINIYDLTVSGDLSSVSGSVIKGLNASNTASHIHFVDLIVNNVAVTSSNYRTYVGFNAFTDPDIVSSDITFNTS